MKSKFNREDIEFLIPDYITGSLGDAEKRVVEDAIAGSAELKQYYNEMKNALDIAGAVKYEDPPQVYFNNLLPRIHDKIEARKAKVSLWDSISVVWKIVVPVAAVLLVFLMYQLLKSPENQVTKKDTDKVLQKKNNTQDKNELPKENKQPEIKKEDVKLNDEMISGKKTERTKNRRIPIRLESPDNKEQKPEENANDKVKKENEPSNGDEFAAIDPEELAVFAGGAPSVLDEETDSELDKLNDTQKDMLLEELINSNL